MGFPKGLSKIVDHRQGSWRATCIRPRIEYDLYVAMTFFCPREL